MSPFRFVTINISGGWNGDLYAYLMHQNGFAVLLNRSGKTGANSFGYSDAGLHVTFNDQASQLTDIHNYQTVGGCSIANGTNWRPDGRNVDPQNVLDTDNRTANLSSFNSLSANGSWTLFLADMSAGDGATLVSWSLDITPVPEPTTVALMVFGIAALLKFAHKRFVASRNAVG